MTTAIKTTVVSLFLSTGILFAATTVSADSDAPAAKVNGVTITQSQVDRAVAKAGAAAKGMPPAKAKQAALEGLITQHLFSKNALMDKLDKDPRVIEAIEEAKEQILARAYAEKQATTMARPTEKEIKAYFDENPELFTQRRIYRLQQLEIQGSQEQLKAVDEKYQNTESLKDFVAWLREKNIRYNMGASTQPAEAIPTKLLKSIAKLKVGQSLKVTNPNGTAIMQLVEAKEEPVTLEQASPAIERYLMNQEAGDIIKSLSQKLRKAAKVEYFAPFSTPGE
jgi:EpsD family peptidyl-prolyl cis-trans isomerase